MFLARFSSSTIIRNSRTDMVVKAGWVSTVAEKYRRNVAEGCAAAVVEAMDAAAAKKS
jgi:hypothetical protein